MKLTRAQERALAKLTDKWKSPYELGERIPTLDGLVRRRLAVMKQPSFGVMFLPAHCTSLLFRLAPKEKEPQ